MSWPLITDFTPVLSRPAVAFTDERLRQCVIETDGRGQPVPRSGQFATVFKGYTDGGNGPPVAIRVFSRKFDERQERYQIVSQFLSNQTVPSMVGFSYQERGIRSARDGRLYPLLVMDWVEGPNLFDWTRAMCQRQDAEALARQADEWLRMVIDLDARGIAHGDLQHGNVLINSDGELRLVDYDCVSVPDLEGRVNLEVGVAPYQHPARDGSTKLSRQLPRFSALFIYVTLRSLAAMPSLWEEFVEQRRYDKLLFQSSDFAAREQSELCNRLANCPDREVRFLVEALAQAYRGRFEEVPALEELVPTVEADWNPYRHWLGIDVFLGSPNYYELLGIAAAETDLRRIQAAAEQRMCQIAQHAEPRYQDLVGQLLREVNEAQLTLLLPDARRQYDAWLAVANAHAEEPATVGKPTASRLPVVNRSTCPYCQKPFCLPRASGQQALRCPFCHRLIAA